MLMISGLCPSKAHALGPHVRLFLPTQQILATPTRENVQGRTDIIDTITMRGFCPRKSRTAWLRACLAFVWLQFVFGTLGESNAVQLARTDQKNSFCGNCPHASTSLPQGQFIHLKFNTTRGFGRTGNYVIAMQNALNLAYLCKAVLELPTIDDRGNAFDFSSQRFFDFRYLKEGEALQASECRNTEEHTVYYWHFQFGAHHLFQRRDKPGFPNIRRLPAINDAPASTQINRCLQQYLGICSATYCRGGHKDAPDEQTVVVHVRHGDIYPSDFASNGVPPEYGQPPLSFYLSIFDFVKPTRVIIVGEPSHEGPVWKAFRMLKGHNALRYEVDFRNGDFRDDLRLMICAETFVESRSSLMSVVRLGFARRIFTAGECFQPAFAPLTKIYSCDVGEEYTKYYERHTNEASEWVDALLQGSNAPLLCQV